MAAAGARMRLTVVVEALAEENAHGEHRDLALAVFKERKFAMPVQLDHTFETVWGDIEQRYKTNYLSPQQAATFSIKKLQDAYDCDLDMADTVGAIFEGEPDRRMHLIKVVPHFIYRETSVVPGSMLRPAGAQKRAADDADDANDDADGGATKRRRVESQQPRVPSPHQPLPSTESQPAVDERSPRSPTGVSLVELGRAETGRAPFSSMAIKQEPPEPGLSPTRDLEEEAAREPQPLFPERVTVLPPDPQDAAIHMSPVSSIEPAPATSPGLAPAANPRRDVYRVPSSPDFMLQKATPVKPTKTYGRSPQSGADLLNLARKLGRSSNGASTLQPGTTTPNRSKASAFQRMQPDEIESTQHSVPVPGQGQTEDLTGDSRDDNDDVEDLTASFLDEESGVTKNSSSTPARPTNTKQAKPGSLKKPSRASLVTTPASTKRGAKSTAAATPAKKPAKKRDATSKTTTPTLISPSGEKALGQDTMSRMERLERLLNASQNTPERQANATSLARNDTSRSQDRSDRSSPEVRIPAKNTATKKAAAIKPSTKGQDTHSSIHPDIALKPTVKTPVPPPTPNVQKLKPACAATPLSAIDIPAAGEPNGFKKPATKAQMTPVPTSSAKNAPTTTPIITPRRSEIPLPPNVRHLRRSSSLQSSPVPNGDSTASKSNLPESVKETASPKQTTRGPIDDGPTNIIAGAMDSAEIANAAVIDASAEGPSVHVRNSESGKQRGSLDGVTHEVSGEVYASEKAQCFAPGKAATNPSEAYKTRVDKSVDRSDTQAGQNQSSRTYAPLPQGRGKQSSGQSLSRDQPWGSQTCGSGQHVHAVSTDDQPEQGNGHQKSSIAVSVSEDEGFAEQDIYSTAIEDSAFKSRSTSAAASTRSSPAVSRRPARFLSHSPTPDASESEGESDGASPALSHAGSLRALNGDESDSESDSSSDSSEDENNEMSSVKQVASDIQSHDTAVPVPASSPPSTGVVHSTPRVPETSQSTPSQIKWPSQHTPTTLPTQHSSQVPQSSQSVSVKAADRRRYTGFRSLREQLADTKAAQASTMKKSFDPRTMSLGRLAKGKPFGALGGDDDGSSDDESSSSSSSSDDSD